MHGSEKVLAQLNKNLEGELTAINQYVAQASLFHTQGYSKLANKFKELVKDEREHSEELIERILFLSGSLTKFSPSSSDVEISDIKAVLEASLASEKKASDDYNEAANAALVSRDNGSSELFKHILIEEEKHINYLESQLRQIAQMGIENYLSSQV